MTPTEKAHIIAIARVCNSTLSDDEIIELYSQYKNDYLNQFVNEDEVNAKVVKRSNIKF